MEIKFQIEYNIEEEITPSKIILSYIPFNPEKFIYPPKPKIKIPEKK